MTNQEAIEHIKTIQIYSYQDGYTDKAREALDMAISALQAQELSKNSPKLDSGNGELATNLQPTCNNDGDLISRQAAFEALNCINGTAELDKAFEAIESLPPAQPDTKAQLPGEGTTSDCISRQAAIEALAVYIRNVDRVYSTGKLSADDCRDAAKSVLDELPSAQPEIIRCKDCKYRGGLSGFYCDIVEKVVGVDSFCSWAERRTDERSD